ncbi:MAG: hypothetical protein HC869_24890 [Rhodospirillales bacterium]|nr:hypothetical protein [Rhodospirillales bacterium]
MATKRETILQALFALLSGLSGPLVLRNANLPERVPAGSIVILRDGDPGEPEILRSPPEYIYDHRADADPRAVGEVVFNNANMMFAIFVKKEHMTVAELIAQIRRQNRTVIAAIES